MGKINYGRVIVGGLVAGLVLNIGEMVLNVFILAKDWDDAMKALNRPPMSDSSPVIYIVLCFALGITLTWLYAAIRPRFAAGPKTAVCAGLVVWTLAYAWSSLSGMAMNLFPARLFLIGMAWGLIEVPLAALVGCWFYRE